MQHGAVPTHDYYVACHLILKQCTIYISHYLLYFVLYTNVMELLSLSLQDYPSEVDMTYPVFLVAVFNFSAVLLDRHHPLFDYIKIS